MFYSRTFLVIKDVNNNTKSVKEDANCFDLK